MTIDAWLEMATRDAERRGLVELKPMLEMLARATAALRAAEWNADASGESDPPPDPNPELRTRNSESRTPNPESSNPESRLPADLSNEARSAKLEARRAKAGIPNPGNGS